MSITETPELKAVKRALAGLGRISVKRTEAGDTAVIVHGYTDPDREPHVLIDALGGRQAGKAVINAYPLYQGTPLQCAECVAGLIRNGELSRY